MGKKSTLAYKLNGVGMWIGFLVVRLPLSVWLLLYVDSFSSGYPGSPRTH